MITTPFLSVDGIIEITINGIFKGIVMIDRRNPPYGTALPGGFVDVGECVEEALAREMREETHLDVSITHLLGIYSDPSRDSRFHTVSAVYIASSNTLPRAGDDAKNARIIPFDALLTLEYAFDHRQIIEDYIAYRTKHPKV
jgi:8-oxo-dGTP diphosphatase